MINNTLVSSRRNLTTKDELDSEERNICRRAISGRARNKITDEVETIGNNGKSVVREMNSLTMWKR